MKFTRIIGILIICFMIIMGISFKYVPAFIDIPSFYLVLGLIVGGVYVAFDLKTVAGIWNVLFRPDKILDNSVLRKYVRVFELCSRLAVSGGAIGTLIGIMLMLLNISDVESLGPNIAIALLTSFYGVFLSELFFQPLKSGLITLINTREDHNENEIKETNNSRWVIYSLAVLFPIIIVLLLMLSMLPIGSQPYWKSTGIKEFQLINFEVVNNMASVNKPISKKWSGIETEDIKWYVTDSTGTYRFRAWFFNRLNKNEIAVTFSMEHEGKDSTILTDGSFEYPISLLDTTSVLFEKDSYSIKFDAHCIGNKLQERAHTKEN